MKRDCLTDRARRRLQNCCKAVVVAGMRSVIVVPSKGIMKTIKKNELFQNLGGFLKSKGIELKDGAYSQRINRACDVLTDAINGTQKTVRRTKVKVDEKLEQLRQSIHEATAPKPSPAAPSSERPSAGAKKERTRPQQKRSSASSKARRARSS